MLKVVLALVVGCDGEPDVLACSAVGDDEDEDKSAEGEKNGEELENQECD